MSLTIHWDNSGKLPPYSCIFWNFEGKWDWNEFMQCDQTAYNWHMEHLDHPIYTIADMTDSTGIPRKGAINFFLKSVNNVVPNRALVTIIAPGRGFMAAIEPIMRRLAPVTMQAYHRVQTLDEAYELILSHMATAE
ncbi:MAG: hypothetical protein CUN56_05190 [Phototrophicales bacterium]|nr:MAG: hypothetical protein CUN56_05190 [Phototrophicales bacterium]RMG69470.1 MAG: hypothetical protein D6711_19290 [Chloroflexota bacterium]